MRFVARTILLFVCLAGCGGKPSLAPGEGKAEAGAAREVKIAAASDLKFALEELAAEFEKQHPVIRLKPTFGSSGNFYAQLANQAPFDVFLSADIGFPRKLIEDGHAAKDTEFLYAVGHLVVWVPNESKLDVEKLGIEAVADPSVKKVAIANPKTAPYGRAAEAALKSLGVYDRVSERLVLGENIAQTAQWVESGAADVGIIALSLAVAPAMRDKGRYWAVPTSAHPPLEQGGVILNWAQDREAAHAFRKFLTSDSARATLKRYGFVLPEA